MKRLRFPSLFWTFAGAFLAVMIVTFILNVLLVFLIIEPISTQLAHSRANSAARNAANEIAAAHQANSLESIESILNHYRQENAPIFLAYRRSDGRLFLDRPLTGRHRRILNEILDSIPEHPRWPHSREAPGRWSPNRGPRRELAQRLTDHYTVRYPVTVDSDVLGQVIAWMPPRRFPFLPPILPRPLLYSLPLAILVAGAAGLIMFRLMSRRLRMLDNLAARVAEGDLSVRVPNLGRDELGQLAQRLNHMTQNLAEAKARVEEGELQRKQLLADISHELATPLTSIRGYTETLLEPSVTLDDTERENYLTNVLGEAKRMDFLIQDLLDLARLESRAVKLETERLNWAELCRNTVSRFQSRFADANISLQWEDDRDPAWVDGDGRRLEQVLENLLTNALRYVPSGGTVTLSMTTISANSDTVHRLEVTDDGPGFPQEDLPRVFDRFYRADEARSTGGSGLGLAIAKEIIQMHHGEIRAENNSPSGAKIMIELPAVP